jgi:hypothetical protein
MPPNSGNDSPQYQLLFYKGLGMAQNKPKTKSDVKRIQSSNAKKSGGKIEKNSFVARIQSAVYKRENQNFAGRVGFYPAARILSTGFRGHSM